jgi:hypothetical protein
MQTRITQNKNAIHCRRFLTSWSRDAHVSYAKRRQKERHGKQVKESNLPVYPVSGPLSYTRREHLFSNMAVVVLICVHILIITLCPDFDIIGVPFYLDIVNILLLADFVVFLLGANMVVFRLGAFFPTRHTNLPPNEE